MKPALEWLNEVGETVATAMMSGKKPPGTEVEELIKRIQDDAKHETNQFKLAGQFQLAKSAIAHVLHAIADDPRKYWLMGNGTESWSKLTEAAAAIWDQPVIKIRKDFVPPKEKYDRHCKEVEANERLLTYCREHGITGK